ncbi:hypothetical protein GUITHDRAFT_101801 [Guillardia theta CCMP2712]|uniref:Uncharacterized protein n=1 Tax=Guillardia theta (strain CCMP2712) TaxID=905079 RepID=L1JWQ3_GUITC|nr:hypothetical protein GUITHDRAFT_101801 [Guillardia theta CCMP2712]EKX52640.1 hypothetical protein GUITHDRAFT_101801 [Guillardia theta CCMP2712]|eukprot:XP_005839620.1 hypothetical protein GUITHDRAFT_101801 [Guillardia theta CCMP2712]
MEEDKLEKGEEGGGGSSDSLQAEQRAIVVGTTGGCVLVLGLPAEVAAANRELLRRHGLEKARGDESLWRHLDLLDLRTRMEEQLRARALASSCLLQALREPSPLPL